MTKPQETWTKEPPKETGWYMARFCDDLPSEPVLVASSRLEGFLVRTWNGDCRTVMLFVICIPMPNGSASTFRHCRRKEKRHE